MFLTFVIATDSLEVDGLGHNGRYRLLFLKRLLRGKVNSADRLKREWSKMVAESKTSTNVFPM